MKNILPANALINYFTSEPYSEDSFLTFLKIINSKKKSLLFFILMLVGLSSLTITTQAQTIVQKHGQLKVSGNKIVDKNGTPVQLNGMSLYWSQWKPAFYNYNTIKWLRDDWCITVVRAAMAVGSGGYSSNPTVEKNKIMAVVDAAIQLGIYVIIDYHTETAYQDVNMAKKFFSEMAQKYKGVPNVLYETFNEPRDVSWSNVLKPYHEQVINSIRQYDTENIIICGTATWSQKVGEPAADPIKKPNIAYTLHYYAGTHKQWLRDAAKSALNKGIAIFVTEYGTTEASGNGPIDYNESKAWWDFLDANSISSCNWSVADLGESSAALNSGTGISNWPSSAIKPSGTLVRNRIKSKCNVSIPQSATPTVALTAPSNNSAACAGTPIDITATASVTGGSINKVDFYDGNTLLGSDNSSPYSYTWNNVTEGSHTIRAIATSATNEASSPATAAIKVSASPVVTITSPSNNADITTNPANIIINATATGNGISSVQFFNGNAQIGEDMSSPYNYTWNNAADGKYSLIAKATNADKCVGTSTAISITVKKSLTPVHEGEVVSKTNCYPNPYVESFKIEAPSEFHYTIYDILGIEVEKGSGEKSAVAGHSLPNGTYFVKVKSRDESKFIKIIKSH